MALFKSFTNSFRRYDPQNIEDYSPNNLTLSCWIFGNHYQFNQHLIGLPSLGYKMFLCGIDGYSHLSAQIGDTKIIDDKPLLDREWTHVAITYNGVIFKLYKNGVEVDLKATDITYGGRKLEQSVWLFHNNAGGNNYNVGLNHFTLWGIPLSNSAVATLAVPETSDPRLFSPEDIILGDFLDFTDTRHIYGSALPEEVVNQEIFNNDTQSPFTGGVVAFGIPDVQLSSISSGSTSSDSIPNIGSSSSTGSSSPSTPRSLSTNSSSSSNTPSISSTSSSSPSTPSSISTSSSNTPSTSSTSSSSPSTPSSIRTSSSNTPSTSSTSSSSPSTPSSLSTNSSSSSNTPSTSSTSSSSPSTPSSLSTSSYSSSNTSSSQSTSSSSQSTSSNTPSSSSSFSSDPVAKSSSSSSSVNDGNSESSKSSDSDSSSSGVEATAENIISKSIVHLDADQNVTTSGDDVTLWGDINNNYNFDTIPSGVPNPHLEIFNGHSAIDFRHSSTNEAIYSSDTPLYFVQKGKTVIVAVVPTAAPGSSAWVYNAGADFGNGYGMTIEPNRVRFGGATNSNGAIVDISGSEVTPTNELAVVAGRVRFNEDNVLYFNGARQLAEEAPDLNAFGPDQITNADPPQISNGPLTIGAQAKTFNRNSRHFEGYIHEIIIFDEPLTDGEILTVMEYLESKWAPTSSSTSDSSNTSSSSSSS